MQLLLPKKPESTNLAISPNGKHVVIACNFSFIMEVSELNGKWKVTAHDTTNTDVLGNVSGLYFREITVSNDGKVAFFYRGEFDGDMYVVEKDLHSGVWSNSYSYKGLSFDGMFYSNYDNSLYVVIDNTISKVGDPQATENPWMTPTDHYCITGIDKYGHTYRAVSDIQKGVYERPSPGFKSIASIHVPYLECRNYFDALVSVRGINHGSYINASVAIPRPRGRGVDNVGFWLPNVRISDNGKILWVDTEIPGCRGHVQLYRYDIKPGGVTVNKEYSYKTPIMKLACGNHFEIAGSGRRVVFVNTKGMLEIKDI